MHRRDVLKKLSDYSPSEAVEKVFKQAFIDFIHQHEECFQRELLIGHLTGSAWILDETGNYALLTHHRKLNRWLQLGGHADGNPDIIEVAKNEAEEESGLKSLKLVSHNIFDIDIHPIPERKGVPEHLHYDIRFQFQANRDEKLVISDESHDLQWIPLHELKKITDHNDSIWRMAQKSTGILQNH